MRLIIMDNADKVSEWAAKYVTKRIKHFNPGPDRYFVLGLPTGVSLYYYYYNTISILLTLTVTKYK